MSIGSVTSTVATAKDLASIVAQTTVRNYVGHSAAELSSLIKQGIEAQLRQVLPVTVFVKVIEEDEDIQLVRYIHEEPAEFIQVEVQATLDAPLKYLVLEFSPELPNAKLGIEFVPAVGSGDASDSPG